jgi:fructose-specific PTS system IIA-like component
MIAEFEFRCPLPSGLHARPASHLAETALKFACAIELRNDRNDAVADAKSVLALVAADVHHGDPCRLRFDGEDAAVASASMREFVTHALPACDVPLPAAPCCGPVVLPRVLRDAVDRVVSGLPVSRGIGRGRLVIAGGLSWSAVEDAGGAGTRAEEQAAVDAALAAVRASLEATLAARPSTAEAGILGAQLALARDASISREIAQRIAAGLPSRRAVAEAGRHVVEKLMRVESAVVRERAVDVEDLFAELLERLGATGVRGRTRLEGPSVLLAESLAPRQLLALDREHLRGLLLEREGSTSHVVILARSFGIPTLSGVRDARSLLAEGDAVVVDAELGFAVREEHPRVRRHYDRQVAIRARQRSLLAEHARPLATTRDGRRVEVGANVGSVEELEAAFANGAEGVGLFRTEMLYLDRSDAPTEDEQLEVFARAVRAANGRKILVRTFDLGGDKPPPWLDLAEETNPFLGRRGARLYPEYPELFDAQVRAILRASALGPVRLLAPMIATPAEARWVRERVAEVARGLRKAGVAFDETIEVGAMIEVPSAAFALREIAESMDFFSVGTNDLAQYFLAADRGDDRLAALRDPRHPAFLRLLAQTVGEARRLGRWIGTCGEMAGDPALLPLLVGLGLDEISAAGPAIPAAKRGIAGLDATECRALLERALAASDANAVGDLLAAFQRSGARMPLTGPELVAFDSDGASKEEVIQELVDLLHENLRTHDPLAVEQAIWSREATYSTGLGGGFAVPHCKTDAVAATSLAVVRLARPVEWESIDDAPVQCAILLAVRASEGDAVHLKFFAALARRLVHAEFRERILRAPDADALLANLVREIEPHAASVQGRSDASTR